MGSWSSAARSALPVRGSGRGALVSPLWGVQFSRRRGNHSLAASLVLIGSARRELHTCYRRALIGIVCCGTEAAPVLSAGCSQSAPTVPPTGYEAASGRAVSPTATSRSVLGWLGGAPTRTSCTAGPAVMCVCSWYSSRRATSSGAYDLQRWGFSPGHSAAGEGGCQRPRPVQRCTPATAHGWGQTRSASSSASSPARALLGAQKRRVLYTVDPSGWKTSHVPSGTTRDRVTS